MLKWFCGLAIVLGTITSANGQQVVTVDPVKVKIEVAEPQQGLTLNGPKEVVSGNFLKLTVDGVESKVIDGIRVPKIRILIDPPTENLIVEDSGYRLYLTEPLAPTEKRKEFIITVAVNNEVVGEAPQMFARRFVIVRGLEPEVDPKNPIPPVVPDVPVVVVPDDAFGNVGKAVLAAKVGLPADKLKALADLYDSTADKLESGEHISLASAQKALIAARDWSWAPAVITQVTQRWNASYQSMSKADYIAFCRAVSAGLRG